MSASPVLISISTPKNVKIILAGKITCRCHRMTPENPVLGRVWPRAVVKEVTSARSSMSFLHSFSHCPSKINFGVNQSPCPILVVHHTVYAALSSEEKKLKQRTAYWIGLPFWAKNKVSMVRMWQHRTTSWLKWVALGLYQGAWVGPLGAQPILPKPNLGADSCSRLF
jgi:hypothetical protein